MTHLKISFNPKRHTKIQSPCHFSIHIKILRKIIMRIAMNFEVSPAEFVQLEFKIIKLTTRGK